MKKSFKIIVSGISAAIVFSSCLAMAHTRDQVINKGVYFDEREGGIIKMRFILNRDYLRDKIVQVMSESISEISGKPLTEISSDIKTHSRNALLVKYNINVEKLKEKMKVKVMALIVKAAEERRITNKEKESMLNHLNHK
tara:strand:- start:1268 stop:1687 length:420 start_codon:yes stop_codon:yes gene_type:complete